MLFVRLAWRNLTRNVRRTTITVMAIAFGLTFCHFAITINTGQYSEMIRVAVSSTAGHVVVQKQGYQKSQDGDLVVEGVEALSAQVASALPGAVLTPRLNLGGLLTSPTASVGVGVSGVVHDVEASVQDVDDKVREGTWLDGDGRGIVIGDQLAKQLGVGLGDKVVYMGQHNGATEVNSRLFRIKGIFHTGAVELDSFLAFVDLPALQEVFGAPDVANRLAVHLQDAETSREAAATVAALVSSRPELDVRPWWEALPELYGLIQLDKTSNDVLMTILGIIVAMGVLNTLLMSVLERTREFGVMLATGVSPSRLSLVILLEGMFVGVVGSALGLALGLLVGLYTIRYGLDYSVFLGGRETIESAGVAISTVLYGEYNWTRMGNYTLGAVLFTTLSAIYPAWYVARLQPVDAMRHV